MSSRPGLTLEAFLLWNYNLTCLEEDDANESLRMAEILGNITPRKSLTKEQLAVLVNHFKDHREMVENRLYDFDEDNQSWRDYAGCCFDFITDEEYDTGKQVIDDLISGKRTIESYKPVVLLQNNKIVSLFSQAAAFATQNGYELIDRSMTEQFDPDNCGVDWSEKGPVLIYGSTDFIKACAKSKALSKYVFNDTRELSIWRLVDYYVEEMLNVNGKLLTVKQISQLAHFDDIHIRPDCEDKAFPGGIYDKEKWDKAVIDNNLRPLLQCWASPKLQVPILKEVRCWVINGKVVATKRYMVNNIHCVENETDQETLDYAQAMANKGFVGLKCYVMDICKIFSGHRIMEFNPINSSGWYGDACHTVMKSWIEAL